MKSLLCVLGWVACVHVLVAQTPREPEEKVIADLMERLIENQESTVDYTDLQEQLVYVLKHKIDLNNTNREELERLFFLSDKDIQALLQHRTDFGDYQSVYELQTVEALDELTVYYLSYLVTVDTDLNDDHTPLFQQVRQGQHDIILLHENDFQQPKGYSSQQQVQGKSYYLGSPYRYVLRYRFNYTGKLSFGYTGEKDKGEQFFQGAQSSGFDFHSVHVMLRNNGRWKALALGDYQASFGQGVTFGSGQAAGKSAYVLNVRRSFQPLRAYRSLNENEFLRGMAATYAYQHFTITVMASRKYISTNYSSVDSLSAGDGNFSNIQLTGLHRTPTEVEHKNNVLQTIYGGHVSYQHALGEVGFTAVSTRYNKSFLPGDQPYQLYSFSGTQLTNMGMDYQLQVRNCNVFGETGISDNGAAAGIVGLCIPLHQRADLALVYRNYSHRYQATFNNAFGENRDGKNEEGCYTGLSMKPRRNWVCNLYVDMYRSPWLRYLTDAPSHGTDCLVEVQYNPHKQTQWYIRYRFERKNKNQSDNSTAVDYTVVGEREQYRVNGQYPISDNLAATSRLELVSYHDETSGNRQGALLFQDIRYTHPQHRFALATRLAVFSVDDYNARVYATEQDVLYQYAVPLYQNSGIRYYLVAHLKIRRGLDLWLKYGRTEYSNVNSIGSGLEQVDGNVLSDMRLQVRYRF